MTIQIGSVAIRYNGPAPQTCHSHKLASLIREQLKLRQARLERASIIPTIIRRWLVAPVLAGVMLGSLFL